MNNYLITFARIFNEGQSFVGHILVRNGLIHRIFQADNKPTAPSDTIEIPAKGKWLIPGVIDDQVHFRDPGLTYKGDLTTESRAAVAGGVTTFMDMPNTIPQTVTRELLAEKIRLGESKSLANFSFFIGATNDNLAELQSVDPAVTCGIKVFMGASTGNMLVDDPMSLDGIFRIRKLPIAVHAEDESIIRQNLELYRKQYGDDIPIEFHPMIRSAEACYKASSFAVELARHHQTRLHLIHLSTARELSLLELPGPVKDKKITSEVCIHHLWFDDQAYSDKGTLIKWNPAIKSAEDREALVQAVIDDKIDIIATDHAPHTLQEKDRPYTQAPSGAPMVQHSLPVMMEFHHQGRLSMEKIVEKMCHTPADLFRIRDRGYIREGYHADLVLINPDEPWTINSHNIYYKCGWTPLEGTSLRSRITQTFVNGNLIYDNGIFDESIKGKLIGFNR
ncbi:MAG: dihydroorotase [Bacteroidetes bacterium GWF2_49_14]|nr:MAG: dihydroorotase [Bacteroidetes bacterium GWF2_49_14]HBB92863.1 dihydroorotase [Bacteroidales bacterium]